MHYKSYLGFDVSHTVVNKCRQLFSNEQSKRFELVENYNGERAELTMSIDVIYHLVEDDIYDSYMERLFSSSDKFVIIYSNNVDELKSNSKAHVRSRMFTSWIKGNASGWGLVETIKNEYPKESSADFFVYQKNV